MVFPDDVSGHLPLMLGTYACTEYIHTSLKQLTVNATGRSVRIRDIETLDSHENVWQSLPATLSQVQGICSERNMIIYQLNRSS